MSGLFELLLRSLVSCLTTLFQVKEQSPMGQDIELDTVNEIFTSYLAAMVKTPTREHPH